MKFSMSTIIIIAFILVILKLLMNQIWPKEKTDKEFFEEILNDPRVNTREVGENNGIEYFQFMEGGKTGFRDLDGNVVVKPIYENAEMYSEGLSAVQIEEGGKYGFIDTKGNVVIKPQFEFASSFHEGYASFSSDDFVGFIDKSGREIIKPQFHWVDEFSEGLCAISSDWRKADKRKYGYIDTSGKTVIDLQFQHAFKFENGIAKIQLNNKWGSINRLGEIIEKPIHPYADF